MINKNVEDWDNSKKRWEAWWNCGIYDRPLIQVTAPKDVKVVEDNIIMAADKNNETKWSKIDHIINRGKACVNNTYFGGEAMPILNPNWSVGHACYFGCEPIFNEDTVWADHLPNRDDGYPEIKFDPNGRWWKWVNEFVDRVIAEGNEMFFLQAQYGNSAADTLAMIRDSQQLMYDLAENPEWVKNSIDKISRILFTAFDHLWEKIDSIGMDGYANWNVSWSPGKTLLVDADISCMVSPLQFKDIFLPSILKQMQTVEYRQFHLDGEALARTHLDTLLGIDEIQSFQWVPGDGRAEIIQWLPLIKKIQDKKKAILVYTTPEEVIPLIKEVRAEGLCISTKCTSESEARRLVESISKMFR